MSVNLMQQSQTQGQSLMPVQCHDPSFPIPRARARCWDLSLLQEGGQERVSERERERYE